MGRGARGRALLIAGDDPTCRICSLWWWGSVSWASYATLLLLTQGGILTAKGNGFPPGEEIPSVGMGPWSHAMVAMGGCSVTSGGTGIHLGCSAPVWGFVFEPSKKIIEKEREKKRKPTFISNRAESGWKCGKRGGKWKTHAYSLFMCCLCH